MTPQGKKIWNCKPGRSLMQAMKGEKRMNKQDEVILKMLVKLSKSGDATALAI